MRDRGEDERKVAAGVSEVFWKQQQLAEEEENWSLRTLFVAVMFGLLLDICWSKMGDIFEEHDVELPKSDILFINVSSWASSYSYRLIKGLEEVTRSQLALVMREYIEQGQTFGELKMAITEIFGPDRAARIAITEVTRVYTEAAREWAAHMGTLGLPMREFWVTSHDELVCNLCRPYDGQELGVGFTYTDEKGVTKTYSGYIREYGPPAHPNCRCDVRYEVL